MQLLTIKFRFSACISANGKVIKYHGNNPSLVMYLSVRRISGRVKYLNTWHECQARIHDYGHEKVVIRSSIDQVRDCGYYPVRYIQQQK